MDDNGGSYNYIILTLIVKEGVATPLNDIAGCLKSYFH